MADLPSRQTVIANEQYMLQFTTPLFIEHEGKVDGPVATGTFFQIEGRYFLVTALHTFESIAPELIRIPASPGTSELIDLGNAQLLKPTDKRYDVCAFEILEHDKKKQLRANLWAFLTLENVALPQDTTFALFGFPYAIKDTGKVTSGYNPLTAYAKRAFNVPPEATDLLPSGLDLFFEYGHEGDTLDGSSVNTPKLQGASGCSIWEMPTNTGTMWLPPKVVGVQIRFVHARYFRAIHWSVVAKIFSLADKQLEAAVLARFK